jgi:DNA-binding transcriptional MerR regulator
LAKSPDAFRTISEAADELGVPQHVLRFWETKFSFVRPLKRAGGRRFYRPQDIAVLKGVRTLLHDQGYTIRGVQKLHREQGVRRLASVGDPGVAIDEADFAPPPATLETAAATSPGLQGAARERLEAALDDVEAAKARLEAALGRG